MRPLNPISNEPSAAFVSSEDQNQTVQKIESDLGSTFLAFLELILPNKKNLKFPIHSSVFFLTIIKKISFSAKNQIFVNIHV